MPIPTEPIGSIPRPPALVEALAARGSAPDELYDAAVADTVARFEATGSPVITDGEQRKPSFVDVPDPRPAVRSRRTASTIPFADGHTRQLPRADGGPFRYQTYAEPLPRARRSATRTRPSSRR